LSEALKKFGLVPWPVDRLAFKAVGRAVRAAYRSPFVRCKNTQRLGCAVPWNRAILRSLSARRMSGPGRNRISNREAVKVSCISFFQEIELRPDEGDGLIVIQGYDRNRSSLFVLVCSH